MRKVAFFQIIIRFMLSWVLPLTILNGCNSFSHFTIDLSTPAPNDPGDHIGSLLLVNRAVDSRFTDDPADSIQLRFFEKEFQIDTVINDLHVTDTLLQVLGDLLFESGRYDIVIPFDRFLLRDSSHYLPDLMKWEEVNRLNRLFRTDAVLSLEFFKTEVSAHMEKESFMNWEIEDQIDIYTAGMVVAYTALFRIYDPANRFGMRSHIISDTLHWWGEDYTIKELFKWFTYVKPALVESGISASLAFSGEIAPRWKRSRRAVFISGNRELRRSAYLVDEHLWEEAALAWENSLANARSKSLKSKLLFNMAVASEMSGDIQEALRLGVESYQTMYRRVTYSYLQTLEERRKLFGN